MSSPDPSPRARLAAELTQLRALVGTPSYRVMAKILDENRPEDARGATVLRDAATAGAVPPRLLTVIQFVLACRWLAERERIGLDERYFEPALWHARWKTLEQPETPDEQDLLAAWKTGLGADTTAVTPATSNESDTPNPHFPRNQDSEGSADRGSGEGLNQRVSVHGSENTTVVAGRNAHVFMLRAEGHLPTTAVLEGLARDSARLFVDVMRLLSVRSSESARRANADGIPYFRELAVGHRNDLREDLAQAGRDLAIIVPFGRIEAKLSWSLRVLDDPRSHAATLDDLVHRELVETSEILAEILNQPGKHANDRRAAEIVVTNAREVTDPRTLPHGPRMQAQTELLARRDIRRRLRSIQEDADNELSIPYFWIDYLLLQWWAAPTSRS